MRHATTAEPDYIAIVSGLPRSGTSMMMQMLAAGGLPPLTDHIRAPDEDNPRGYYEFEAVKQVGRDASWLEAANGKVVKMVYRLLHDLPPDQHYRVVFMRRDLREVVASQEVMLERQGKGAADVPQERVRQIFDRQVRDTIAWLRTRPNFSVLYVNYHDVVEDAARVVDALDRFFDGRLDREAMLGVPDTNLYRQRGSAAEAVTL